MLYQFKAFVETNNYLKGLEMNLWLFEMSYTNVNSPLTLLNAFESLSNQFLFFRINLYFQKEMNNSIKKPT